MFFTVFYNGRRAKFNPYGPAKETRINGEKMDRILQEHEIRLVCGFDYVADIAGWREKFSELLASDVLRGRRKQ